MIMHVQADTMMQKTTIQHSELKQGIFCAEKGRAAAVLMRARRPNFLRRFLNRPTTIQHKSSIRVSYLALMYIMNIFMRLFRTFGQFFYFLTSHSMLPRCDGRKLAVQKALYVA